MASSRIKHIRARQVLDNNGRPVAEVDVYTHGGHMGRAGASTGTSVGANEAFVLRDNDPKIFAGLSVYKAIDNIEKILAPALIGMDVLDQQAIDHTMIALDGTRYKTNLGGNAMYALSIAAARAAAAVKGLPLHLSMAKSPPSYVFAPTANVINGGSVQGKTLNFQEFMIMPYGISDPGQGTRIICEVFIRLGDVIKKETGQAGMGSYSGYGVPTDDPGAALDMISEAVAQLGYQRHVCYALDCAASEFYVPDEGAYRYRGRLISREELLQVLAGLADKYPMAFIEDPLEEEDFVGYRAACKQLNTLVLGDDILCTSLDRTRKACEMESIHGMVFKPNQAGTLTEAVEAAGYMLDRGMPVVASGRAGGTADAPERELAVALGIPLAKNGAPRGTRVNGYNYMLRTAEDLGVPMADISKLQCFSHLKI